MGIKSAMKRLLGRGVAVASLAEYMDEPEEREWTIVGDLKPHVATRRYPDFDLAYLHFAMPDPYQPNQVDTAILQKGLENCRKKSRILAALAAYNMRAGDPLQALDYSVAYIRAKQSPISGPGDHILCLRLLTRVLGAHGHSPTADAVAALNPGIDLSGDPARAVARSYLELKKPEHGGRVAQVASLLDPALARLSAGMIRSQRGD